MRKGGGVQCGGEEGRESEKREREGREGIWTGAKARSSAKHTVQECQQTPLPPGPLLKRGEKEKRNAREGKKKVKTF